MEYDWYKYLILLIVCIVLFYFIFNQLSRTRDYEDVNIFVTCYDSQDESDCIAYIKNRMRADDYPQDRFGKNVLRSIGFETVSPLDSNYSTLLSTHGQITSDILVLGKSRLDRAGAAYLELTDEVLNDYILYGLSDEIKGSLEYYTWEYEGKSYRMGIKISDMPKSLFVTDWRKPGVISDSNRQEYEKLTPEEQSERGLDTEFYLVINRSSVNIGKFGKKSKNRDVQALYVVNRMLQYFNRSNL